MKSWLLRVFETQDLELAIGAFSVQVVWVASALLVVFLILAALLKNRLPKTKPWLFGLISVAVVGATIILVSSTVYLNNVSLSGGPVHRHADFEFWNCGQQVELRDPQGRFSNKIGTTVLHEHNDQRIHLEGVVVEERDGSLGKFMRVVGGSLSSNSLVVPTNEGRVSMVNGDECQDQPGELAVFLYQTTDDGYYSRRKLENPADYSISDESVVPPGDCIIFEFDTTPSETDKLCRQYEVALDIGDLKGFRE